MQRFLLSGLARFCRLSRWALPALVVLSSAGPLWAQLPAARLNSVYPAGGQQGTTVEVTLAGADLDDVSKLHFSHPGITAAQKMSEPGPMNKPKPVENRFVVTIPADVPVGLYELRAIGKYGISNPRAFLVGDLPETSETEPNNTAEQASEAKLNTVVNGLSNGATDLDYFKFEATKGQRVLVDTWAQRIDSRMDPAIAIYDAQGLELTSNRDFNRRDAFLDFTVPADGTYYLKVWDFVYGGGSDFFYRLTLSTGPYIDFVLPPAGTPGTTGKFVLYGRNLPGGTPAEGLKIAGRSLEQLAVDIAIPSGPAAEQLAISSLVSSEGAGLDGFEYRLQGPQGRSNPVLIGFATAAPVAEQEPNNAPASAQKITVPTEVYGQFYPRSDHDWFTFEAAQGEVYWVEALCQRRGRGADPKILLQRVEVDDKGQEKVTDIQDLDDVQNNTGGVSFDTRTDDPAYRFTVPANGTYRVLIADLYQRGDPRYVYRLSIRPESPDFRLVAVPNFPTNQPNQAAPWTNFLRKGGTAAIDVVAFRRDGFDGEIEVTAKGLPPGVTCRSVILGPTQGNAPLVLVAADNAAEWSGTIQIEGKARIGDREVVRQARGGAVVWPAVPQQQFAAESRLARDIALSVSGGEMAPFQVAVAEEKVFEMSRAGKLEVPLKAVRRGDFKGNLALSGVGVPANIKVNNVAINAGAGEAKLQIELPNNAPLGTYTFNLTAQTQVNYARNPEAAAAAEAEKKELEQLVAQVTEENKKAAEAKAAADKAAAETAAQAKQAADAKAAAEKAAADAEAASKAAAEKAKAAAQAAAQQPDKKELADAKTAAEQAAAEAAAKAKTAAEQAATQAKAAEEAAAKAQAAAEAKAAAEKAAAAAAEKLKAAQVEQTAAAKRATDLTNAAKPKQINVFEASTPITIKITAAPINAALAADKYTVKQGAKIEVPVRIERLYGYNDPVELELVAQGVGGLKVDKVTIPAGQSEGKLVVEAAPNAAAGTHTVTIRSTARFNGQALPVDQTATLAIEAAPPQ